MENLPALNLKNLDKSKWKTYRFDEIAKNISERVDPNNTDLEVYVGLEHIDSESIHLKRSGTPDDVDGQKLRFYPGDVIFGRRRAYQRKAAVATTHGFCSAHALVLRANPEVINPQLFPFFMHSDAFMHRAVDISVGSLSPTINWGTLKHQQFRIPGKEIQAKLAELLKNLDNYLVHQLLILEKLEKLFLSTSDNIFKGEQGIKKSLKEVATIVMGQSPTGDTYNKSGLGMPFLQGNSEFGTEYPSHQQYTSSPLKTAKKDSILVSVRAPVGDLNIADRDYCIGRGLASVEVTNQKLRTYLYYFLQYSKSELDKNSTGSTFKSINKDTLSNLKVTIPTESDLEIFAEKFKTLSNNVKFLSESISNTKSLQKTLLIQIF